MTAYFPPLCIGGLTYNLSHLEPFTFTIQSQLAKRDLRIRVTFSNHCFSKGYDQALHPGGEPILLDHSRRQRTFCAIRYRLSLSLPPVIKGLNHPQAKVRETAAMRNWAYSVMIEDPVGPYHVFFELRRAAEEKPQDLNLVVESAYHQAEKPPRLFGKMGFMLLAVRSIFFNQPPPNADSRNEKRRQRRLFSIR